MSNAEHATGGNKDIHGRAISYLRLSITDRCNLACVYCCNSARKSFLSHDKILRYEELLRIVRIAVGQGIRKVRLTGGEPFARKDCLQFMRDVRKEFPDISLSATTNGTLLEPAAADLKKIGLSAINISLDSFQRETFARLTGKDLLPATLANIERLLTLGLKVKINAVALKGVTDVQIDDFIYACKTMPLDMRFIEFMPMGEDTLWEDKLFLSASEIFKLIEKTAVLERVYGANGLEPVGPAKMWRAKGFKGQFGFISALSDHFCSSCNRLRLTSDGKLRACLFADREYNLAPMLRHPRLGDRFVEKVMREAGLRKPLGHDILISKRTKGVSKRQMCGIGG